MCQRERQTEDRERAGADSDLLGARMGQWHKFAHTRVCACVIEIESERESTKEREREKRELRERERERECANL